MGPFMRFQGPNIELQLEPLSLGVHKEGGGRCTVTAICVEMSTG